MTVLGYTALATLGIAFCIGCGDSSTQSWETSGKPLSSAEQASREEKGPKADNVPDDHGATMAEGSGTPQEMASPHGGMGPHSGIGPHGGMFGSGATSETKVDDGKLNIETVHFTVPKLWVPKPHGEIFQAEFAIPRMEGDKKDGRLTVSQTGGGIKANLDRWKGQFEKLDKENQEILDVGGTKVTLVDFSGTFDDQRGMGPTPDYRLLGASFPVPGDDRLYFIKCYGPSKTMAARAAEIVGFIKSLQVDK